MGIYAAQRWEFMVVGAFSMDSTFQRNVHIIGMPVMQGGHSRIHSSEAIPRAFSTYEFNKKKIWVIFSNHY
jgi:hypothetical protein